MSADGVIVLLLVVAAAVGVVAMRLRIPYTVALVAAGLVLGSLHVMQPPVLTKELLFAVFLPGLLFEAAYHLDASEFWRNRVVLLALALPGVAVAMGLTALGLSLAGGAVGTVVAIGPAIVFGSLIAATDPIAVVAIVRTLGVPLRLRVLIEGESLLNDGTAAIAFVAAVAYVLGQAQTPGALAFSLAFAIVAGVGIGFAFGSLASWIIPRLSDPMLLITVTSTVAYGSFIVAESVHASGVLSTVTAGLLIGTDGVRGRLTSEFRASLAAFWDYIAFALNSLVFLLIGFQTPLAELARNWRLVALAYLVVTAARAIVTYTFAALLPRRDRLPRGWATVITWSGLRGGLAMVLALSLPETMPQRAEIITMTTGVVVLSILFQGLTVAPLLRWLGIEATKS